MDQPPVQSAERTLATLLFNTGVEASRVGRRDEAVEAFTSAARLEPSDLRFAIVACKACFAVGRLEDAEVYLKGAKSLGAGEEQLLRMSKAIKRAAVVQASDRVPACFEPGVMEQPGASWILAFCNWLESVVHEICEDLRESVAER